MAEDKILVFLSQYDNKVYQLASQLRALLLQNLPGIIEQLDLPARMVAYCYGQTYSDLICVIIPSKKGLKLGFNKGSELSDPDNMLEGAGKTSKYVVISSEEIIKSKNLKALINEGFRAYKKRSS